MITGILDLSSMFHRLWSSDRDNVEHRILNFLKNVDVDEIIVAVDSPPYKRKEVYPEYKANRDTPDPELVGLLKLVKTKIYQAGFKMAMCEGAEADDVIAKLILDIKGDVVVYGADKDLLQCTDLIDPLYADKLITAKEKLGVEPEQVVDYLALLGDTSDNLPGVHGIGKVNASKLLDLYGSIDEMYKEIESGGTVGSEKITENLINAKNDVMNTIPIIKLDTSIEVKFHQLKVEEEKKIEDEEALNHEVETEPEQIESASDKMDCKHEVKEAVTVGTLPAVKPTFNNTLEPVDLNQAYTVAKYFDRAGMYQQFKGPEQILMVVMRGRELGLGAMASLDTIDIMPGGKPAMRAAAMSALVQSRRDLCEYLICTYSDKTKATWSTKRVGCPHEITVTFTIEDAKDMMLVVVDENGNNTTKQYKDKWGKTRTAETRDNWKKQPKVMLQWRACSQLIRQVYPDVIFGLYAREEFE